MMPICIVPDSRSGCTQSVARNRSAGIRAAIDRLAAERIFLPIVAYGVHCPPEVAAAAVRAGAREFLPLPPEPELIAAILAAVGEDRRELVCVDSRMAEVLARARRFAAAEACVLITGESGTGKEMVARFVHRHGRRAGGPFVAVNCAAIPEALLESELFGHERGAFTGAVARRIGRFEEAHGGTLLLDEVSEMEPRLQAKLLRAIQEREIDRVGGARPVRVDIRRLDHLMTLVGELLIVRGRLTQRAAALEDQRIGHAVLDGGRRPLPRRRVNRRRRRGLTR